MRGGGRLRKTRWKWADGGRRKEETNEESGGGSKDHQVDYEDEDKVAKVIVAIDCDDSDDVPSDLEDDTLLLLPPLCSLPLSAAC